MKTKKRVGVLSDIHLPFEDPVALPLAIEYLKEHRIQELFLNGDICDFLAISRFNKTLERRAALRVELDSTLEFLAHLKRTFRGIPIRYIKGNHESRWDRFLIESSPELIGLPGMSLPERLKLKEFDITWHEDKIIENDLVFYHGEGRSSREAGGSVKMWLRHFMASVIIGHIHKQAVIYQRTGTGRVIVGIENPALCLMDPEYEHTGTCNWQQGGTIIDMDFSKKINTPHPFQIQEGEVFGSLK